MLSVHLFESSGDVEFGLFTDSAIQSVSERVQVPSSHSHNLVLQ